MKIIYAEHICKVDKDISVDQMLWKLSFSMFLTLMEIQWTFQNIQWEIM